MGMFSFIKEAGEKLFGSKDVEKAAEAAAADPAAQPTLDELNSAAAKGITTYIESQNLGLSGLCVMFDGASGKVTVQGDAPTQEAVEKVPHVLACEHSSGHLHSLHMCYHRFGATHARSRNHLQKARKP